MRQHERLPLDAVLSPPLRCHFRPKIDGTTERLALRAVLSAARLFGLAAGTHLRQLRNLDDPLATMQARLDEAQLHARLAWEIVEILSARFRRIPEKHRPYYSPAQRFRILEIKSLLGWPHDVTARVFLVCSNTISNWHRAADPLAKVVGSLVKPTPAVTRLADVVRATAQLLVRCGLGQDRAALTLARAGWRVSARSVRRVAKEPQHRTIPPDAGYPKPSHPVLARFVHHTWMMDVTEIPALLGSQVFHLAGVFDAFSRSPLALQLSPRRPRACDMARLLKAAARTFGAPKYLITDLGGEF